MLRALTTVSATFFLLVVLVAASDVVLFGCELLPFLFDGAGGNVSCRSNPNKLFLDANTYTCMETHKSYSQDWTCATDCYH